MTSDKSVNYTLVAFMVIAFILLLVVMIYSAMSSTESKKSKDDDCKKASKNAMISAIVSGVAAFCLLIIMIMYVFTNRKIIASHTAEALKQAQTTTQNYANAPPTFVMPSN